MQLRRTSTPALDAQIHAELQTIAERNSPTMLSRALLPGRPSVRTATPGDRIALQEMARRCGPETLRRRFHAPSEHLNASQVVELVAGTSRIDAIVAELDAQIVGIASLHLAGNGDGEIAVMVEDAFQSGGLGGRLTAHLLRRAAQHGITAVVADVLCEPRFVVESLERHNVGAEVHFDGPVATVRMPVPCQPRGPHHPFAA